MPLTIPPSDFLSKYDLPNDALERAGLSWDDLRAIFTDHENNLIKFDAPARMIVDQIRSIPGVHSLRYRVKDPEHLVEKIIRKKLERPDFPATLDTYRTGITDLVGVRALHLFKDEWLSIHQFICATWNLKEGVTANVREGDDEDLFKAEQCTIKRHAAGYRSVHYLVELSPTKEPLIVEVQVRTLFEEAWSEIDHQIRYPHAVDNTVLAEFLEIFNRLAGSADEMGSYVKVLQAHLKEQQKELEAATVRHDQAVQELEKAISQTKLEKKEKTDLEKRVKELAEQTKRNLVSVGTPLAPITINAGDILTGARTVIARPNILARAPTVTLTVGDGKCTQCGRTFRSVFRKSKCDDCEKGEVSGKP